MAFRVDPNYPQQQLDVQGQEQVQVARGLDQNQMDGIFLQTTMAIQLIEPFSQVAGPIAQIVANLYPVFFGNSGLTNTTTTSSAGVAAVETTINPPPTT